MSLAKVDVDQNQAVAARYNVSSVPLVVGFDKGKAGPAFVGVVPEAALHSFVKGLLGQPK